MTTPSVRVEPAISTWKREGDASSVWATGHQVTHWHAGILAKYLAIDEAAQRYGGRTLNVVVDQDVANPLRVVLPFVHEERVGSQQVRALVNRTVTLGRFSPGVAVGQQAAADARDVLRRLRRAWDEGPGVAACETEPLLEAWSEAQHENTPNLAVQMADVLDTLMTPYRASTPDRVMASALVDDEMVERLRERSLACAVAYNRAAGAVPEAGIGPLHVGVDHVEVPLWALGQGGRGRVYVEQATGELVTFTRGVSLDRLAPRALMLTALMRSRHASLFVHGTGGAVYDRVTEAWWQDWTGETLQPMAMASADGRLDFDVPMASADDVQRAVWWAHHLPHNVTRHVAPDSQASREKADLLQRMDSSANRKERRAFFETLQTLNEGQVAEHHDVVQQANADAKIARIAHANHAVASRRDACFALLPEATLRALRKSLTMNS